MAAAGKLSLGADSWILGHWKESEGGWRLWGDAQMLRYGRAERGLWDPVLSSWILADTAEARSTQQAQTQHTWGGGMWPDLRSHTWSTGHTYYT